MVRARGPNGVPSRCSNQITITIPTKNQLNRSVDPPVTAPVADAAGRARPSATKGRAASAATPRKAAGRKAAGRPPSAKPAAAGAACRRSDARPPRRSTRQGSQGGKAAKTAQGSQGCQGNQGRQRRQGQPRPAPSKAAKTRRARSRRHRGSADPSGRCATSRGRGRAIPSVAVRRPERGPSRPAGPSRRTRAGAPRRRG